LLDSIYDPLAVVNSLSPAPNEPSITAVGTVASNVMEIAGARGQQFIQSAYGSISRLGNSVLWAVSNVVAHTYLLPALEIEQLRCGDGTHVCKEDGLGLRGELIDGLDVTAWFTTDSWHLCTVNKEPIRNIIFDFVHNDNMTHGLIRDACSGPNCIPIGSTERNPAQELFVVNGDFTSISQAAKTCLLCIIIFLICTYTLRLLPVKFDLTGDEEIDIDTVDKTTMIENPGPLGSAQGTISINDVSVNARFSEKALLQNLSFEISPGTITGLIGPSGAGKSTLFNLLCGQLPPGLQGFKRSDQFEMLGIQTSYLRQFGNSSLQNIELSAYLKLTSKLYGASESELESVVSFVRKTFADRVGEGDDFGGVKIKELSGGQQRIVAIVATLLTSPKLLLLDEPLSGLDSVSSQQVMEFLRDIVKEKSCSVILSLHQPSDLILEQIDKIMVLNAGSLIMNEKIRDSKYVHEILEKVSKGEEITTDRERKSLMTSFRKSKAYLKNTSQRLRKSAPPATFTGRISVIGQEVHEFAGFSDDEEEAGVGRSPRKMFQITYDLWQIRPLMRRMHLEYGAELFKFFELPTCYALICVLLQFNKGSPMQYLFATVLFCCVPVFIFQSLLLKTCTIYNAHQVELQDGRISPTAFTLSSFLYTISAPFCSIALGVVIGYAILQWDYGTYIDQYLFACLYFIVAYQLGRVLATAFNGVYKNVDELYVLFVAYSILMSGALMSPNKLPPPIRWLTFLSIGFWSISGINLVHFAKGSMFNNGDIICTSLESCILQDGSFLARLFGYTPLGSTRSSYVVLLSSFIVLFVMEFAMMYRKHGKKRNF